MNYTQQCAHSVSENSKDNSSNKTTLIHSMCCFPWCINSHRGHCQLHNHEVITCGVGAGAHHQLCFKSKFQYIVAGLGHREIREPE